MSALPVSEKEGERRGKNSMGPRVKNGHANLLRKNAFKMLSSYLCGNMLILASKYLPKLVLKQFIQKEDSLEKKKLSAHITLHLVCNGYHCLII